jgi:hypothetical protein
VLSFHIVLRSPHSGNPLLVARNGQPSGS